MNLRLFFGLSLVVSLFIVLAIGSSSPTHAQSGQNVEFVGQIGGDTQAVFVQGNYAYIGEGPRLVILDVSNPSALTVVGKSEPLHGIVRDIQAVGNYAYVGDDKGLQILDMSNPAQPTLIGQYESLAVTGVSGIYVSGNYAYLTNGNLHIIDISNATSPTYVGNYGIGGALEVQVKNNFAYVAAGSNGLQVIDISNPINPVFANQYDVSSSALDVYISGNYVYVASSYAGVVILDISVTPGVPTLAGDYSHWYTNSIFVLGSRAYITTRNGLEVLDITNSANPTLLGDYSDSLQSVKVFAAGDFAYVADVRKGLQSLDVSYLDFFSFIWEADTYSSNVMNTVRVHQVDNYAYILDNNNGLQIVDTQVISNPVLVGSYSEDLNWSMDIKVSGDYAYILDNGNNNLKVFNIADPTNPSYITSYDGLNDVYCMDILGNYVYIAGTNGGYILNLSNPESPALVGTYTTSGFPLDIQAVGNYIYIADWYHGLQIIDVSTPTNPSLIESFDTDGISVQVAGNYAYWVNLAGLNVIDISNPIQLNVIANYDSETSEAIQDVYINGNYAYLAIGQNGVQVINIADPYNPIKVGDYFLAGTSLNLSVINSNIYVATSSGGFNILSFANTYTPTPIATKTPTPVPTSTPMPITPVPLTKNYFDNNYMWTANMAYNSNKPVAGDMDLDGDLDVLVANQGSDTNDQTDKEFSLIYENMGGTFSSSPVWKPEQADHTNDAAWCDVNGDGYLDVVLANGGVFVGTPNKVYLSQQGKIAQQPAWQSYENDKSTSVACGDVDGDGDNDLVFGNWSESTKFYRNNNGVLQSVSSWTLGGSGITKVLLTDINRDNYLDLLTSGYKGVKLYLGNGNTFQTTPQWSVAPDPIVGTSNIVLGDLDGDSDLDLVATRGSGYLGAYAYRNNNGSFASTPFWNTNTTNNIELGDIDGDTDLDLITTGYAYINNNGNFQTQTPLAATTIKLGTLADINQDGILDMTAVFWGKFNKAYTGLSLKIESIGKLFSNDRASCLALGDVNGDGYLDVLLGNDNAPAKLYLNNHGTIDSTASWNSPYVGGYLADVKVAFGDVDMDDDLDVFVGNQLYLYDNGQYQNQPVWQYSNDNVKAVAFQDVDGDKDPDLAIAAAGYVSLYLNNQGILSTTPSWQVALGSAYSSNYGLLWGDINSDGDSDLIVLEDSQVALFSNNLGLSNSPDWHIKLTSQEEGMFDLKAAALGDLDSDGDLDLAVGRWPGTNQLYLNEHGQLSLTPIWTSEDGSWADDMVWGDIDNDGDADLIVSNSYINGSNIKIYRSNNNKLDVNASWSSSDIGRYQCIALGDIDHDGDFDLVASDYHDAVPKQRVYYNLRSRGLKDNPIPTLHIQQPNKTSNANGYASAKILSTQSITLTYTLFHSASMRVDHIEAYYSLNGGGKWLPAIAANGTITQNLTTSPLGTAHTFVWDTQASGFFGHSDNVVIRLVAIPSVIPQINGVAGEYRYGSFGAATLPFRARGSQIRVTNNGIPMANAIVYRNGQVLVDSTNTPLQTDGQGYLQGQAELHNGDHLLAMAPIVSATQGITWTNAMTLYYTNPMFQVTQPGVQQLVVSADHPLLLIDLWVSLEFDASRDSRQYLDQLIFKLRQTSQHLYDFTDGQVALGKITVMQNGDNAHAADMVIHSSNVMRPFATIGGVVITATVDGNKIYFPGQVHMPATWSKWGDALGSNESGDWSLVLAHELGHYLFFLQDTYIGVTTNDLLIATDDCPGAMGDVYRFDNQLFMNLACGDSLASRLGQPDEWTQILRWYPWLKRPVNQNASSTPLPAEFTTVTAMPPMTPTTTLADVSFNLDYITGMASSNVQGYLIRDTEVFNLGSPVGGQNLLWARGARPGDRLCVFDLGRDQFGCETVALNDNRVQLKLDASWQPIIKVSPINSTTFTLEVEGLASGLPLKARLLPLDGLPTADLTLQENSQGYSYTLHLAESTSLGYVQVWVNESYSETNPRREAMVGYTMSGGPGHKRTSGGGGTDDDGGGHKRTSGGGDRRNLGAGFVDSGDAPILSMNGNLIYVDLNEPELTADAFYTIQDMASCPPLPPGKKVVDVCYYLYGSAAAPPLTGSVTLQYSTYDLIQENISAADEEQLTLYFWDGTHWQALDTTLVSYFNWASAFSQGSGVYALMSGETTPILLEIAPTQAINNITNTLTITGLDMVVPIQVTFRSITSSYSLPFTTTTLGVTTTVTAIITPGLPAAEYEVIVTNLADQTSTQPVKFALYEPNPTACFYDTFGSGLWGKWQVTPNGWQIDSFGRLNDSVDKSYGIAPLYGPALTYTNMITSMPFSLANCPSPALKLYHANAIVPGDVARVEVSTDGQTWVELPFAYTPISGQCEVPRTQRSDEWAQAAWQTTMFNLSPYSQSTTIQLRFSLEINATCADKGWVIDELSVLSYMGPFTSPTPTPTFTPSPTSTPLPIPTTATPASTFTPIPTVAPTSAPNMSPKPMPIPNLVVSAGGWFNPSLPNPPFMDNEALTYSRHLADGSAWPEWLTIDTFSWSVKGLATNNQVGDYIIVLSASDSLSQTAITTFTLTILPINLPPTRTQLITQVVITEDETIHRDFNGVFTDTDPLTLTILDELPPGLTFVNGVLQGSVPNDGVGSYLIGLLATDTALAQNQIWFQLVVTNSNDAPIAQPDLAQMNKNQPIVICPLINDSDPDKGDNLIISTAQANQGQVVIKSPCLDYTPALDFMGLDTLTYTIRDQSGLTSTTTITVAIGGIQAADRVITMMEDVSLTIPFTLPLKFATVISGQLTLADNQLIYLPPPDFYGNVTLDYLVSDQTTFSMGRIIITVLPVNDAPLAHDDVVIITYQPNITFTVLPNDSDPDHNVLTVTQFTVPQHGQLSQLANHFMYTPTMAYNGVDSFHYVITDGVLTSTAMVTIYVFAYPAPIAVGDNFTLRQARGITFTPLSNDLAFSGTLTLLQVQTPQHGIMQQIGSTLIYTPDHDFVGTEVFTYQIADNAATAMGLITITVISDTPPVAMPDIITLTHIMSQALEPLVNDFDGEADPLTITQITQPLSGTTIISGSQLVYSPTVIFTATDMFSYTISDGVLSATTTITVIMKLPPTVYLPMLLKSE